MTLTLTKTSTPLARSEQQLVAATRAGDDRAYAELYSRYRERIFAFILARVHDHGRAEDIAQEVFISALRRLRASDQRVIFKPWIYEIAKNACIDEFRRGARAREVPLEADGEMVTDWQASTPQSPPPGMVWENKQRLDDLRGAFGGLSDSHHKLLLMREFEGLSYDEIGQRLGMTRQMVESGLFRARRKLGEEYEELASGRRCEQVQVAIDSGSLDTIRGLGVRDRRRFARHLSHCQPCRHIALMAGVDATLVKPRSIAAKIAAFLPFPFLRRLIPGSRHAGASPGGAGRGAASGAGHGAASGLVKRATGLAHSGAPALAGRGAAAVAALALAGAGGGLIHELGTGSAHANGLKGAKPAAWQGTRSSTGTRGSGGARAASHAVASPPAAPTGAAMASRSAGLSFTVVSSHGFGGPARPAAPTAGGHGSSSSSSSAGSHRPASGSASSAAAAATASSTSTVAQSAGGSSPLSQVVDSAESNLHHIVGAVGAVTSKAGEAVANSPVTKTIGSVTRSVGSTAKSVASGLTSGSHPVSAGSGSGSSSSATPASTSSADSSTPTGGGAGAGSSTGTSADGSSSSPLQSLASQVQQLLQGHAQGQ